MNNISRHFFVPSEYQNRAYEDHPLQIGKGQTISAPHMNAMMCELLKVKSGDNILEVGTGSGYHAALLSYLTGENGNVITIERHQKLADNAMKVYKKINITNITVIVGDGTLGDPENAPFDKILVTAAGPEVPPPLLEQLSVKKGILCMPVGSRHSFQALYTYTKSEKKIKSKKISGVMFVPLIGKYGFPKS